METLQMFDASGGMDWAESLQNALGKDGEVAEDADAVPPIAVPAASALEPGESEIPASQTSQPEDAKPEEIEIPPTQPSPHPTLPDPESPAPEVPLEKYLNGPYDTSPEEPQGGENTRKDEEEEKPLAKGLPEESPEFPMVSRESQHAFKNSKGYVAKMDAANRGDGPPMKRPAAKSGAKAKAKAKRTKQDSLAQPVPPAGEAGTEDHFFYTLFYMPCSDFLVELRLQEYQAGQDHRAGLHQQMREFGGTFPGIQGSQYFVTTLV